MKKLIVLAFAAMMMTTAAYAQEPAQKQHCGNCKHHQQTVTQQAQQPQVTTEIKGIDMAIVRAFPTVEYVKKASMWTEVYDAHRQLLGYAVYSKPSSNGIKGYAGETPVFIALDKNQVIAGVWLLENQETPKFVQRVENAGYFNNWNGLTIKKALKKEVDTVSGATFTSRAVALSVQAALKQLL